MASKDKAKEEFGKLHKEWREYHEGEVEHPETGEMVSKAALRAHEIGDVVEKEFNKLKEKISRGRKSREELEPQIYELAEKTYLADQGVKDIDAFKKSLENTDILRQQVKTYLTRIAAEALPRDERGDIETYEDVIEKILEASNPIYGRTEGERSRVLDFLIQLYAQKTHKSEHKDTKGHRQRRLEYLQTELSNKKYLPPLKDEYSGIFGDSGHKFDKNVKPEQILDVAREALGGEVSSSTLRRKYILNPPGKPLKKVQYTK